MKTLSVSEARANLPRLAEEVARTGESVLISRRGRPVAKLVPVEPGDGEQPCFPLRGVPIRIGEDFHEGGEALWEACEP